MEKKKRRVFLFLPPTNLVDLLYRLALVLYSILETFSLQLKNVYYTNIYM